MRLQTVCLLIISVLLLASCGTYDKLLKSRDYNAKYEYALKMYQVKKDNKAITLFESIAPIFAGTDKIDTIKFYTAKSYYRQKDFLVASSLLDEFRKSFTRSPFAEESEFLYAMSHYEIAPNPELDQTHTRHAISAFQEYVNRYSESPKVETCKELIEELMDRLYIKAFLVGKNYYDIGYYNSAIHEFKNILKHYPDITSRERIMYLIVKSSYQYAKASVEQKQRERYYNTIDSYLSFIDEFPESKYIVEVEKMYENSQKLAKGQEIIETVAKDLKLSDRTINRGSKKYVELFDKVQDGKITKDEAKDLTNKMIDKNKRRAGRKDLLQEADSAARKSMQIKAIEERAMREQGRVPELERAAQEQGVELAKKKKKDDASDAKTPKDKKSKKSVEAVENKD